MSLTAKNISLTVADGTNSRTLLNNVSLDIKSGEVVGIVGPSGSGKSTLLGVLGCLQDADAGTAILETATSSVDLLNLKNAQQAALLRREHIGIVFQQPNLLPSLRVIDQLMLIPHLGRVLPLSRSTKKRAEAKALELLSAIGLPNIAKRKVGELSGGQQARVNLARALMNEPDLLLVDEPTAALDQHSAREITQLIVSMAHEFSAATLYVSHDMEQIKALDRYIELVDGRVLDQEKVGATL
ncbi:ABC transporter ATP-binding protein [Corynebacterium callunae]|uniref:ABC-type transport system, involved in lipoprotein release, ATPase component n=1 Tax=Corynebacterium callunae DSM 20147 TaxID=1121353 RepID=M1UZF5_9CORY|nr:ABC transporter ATP-binding protein [Corynebacterium callunae]AGG67138.1 ABC-type transport system, involved in lipoprotein release, ATPase component [Corynebacterium callunae DSM 20147]